MYLLYIYLYVGKNNSFIVYLCVCVSVLGAVKASGESGYVLSKSDVSYHQLQRYLFHNNMSECRRSNEYISAFLCSTVSAPAKVDDDAIFRQYLN